MSSPKWVMNRGGGTHDIVDATVEVRTSGGRVQVCGCVVDDVTGDPTTILALGTVSRSGATEGGHACAKGLESGAPWGEQAWPGYRPNTTGPGGAGRLLLPAPHRPRLRWLKCREVGSFPFSVGLDHRLWR